MADLEPEGDPDILVSLDNGVNTNNVLALLANGSPIDNADLTAIFPIVAGTGRGFDVVQFASRRMVAAIDPATAVLSLVDVGGTTSTFLSVRDTSANLDLAAAPGGLAVVRADGVAVNVAGPTPADVGEPTPLGSDAFQPLVVELRGVEEVGFLSSAGLAVTELGPGAFEAGELCDPGNAFATEPCNDQCAPP